jgi:phospholipid-binding lipoprotein MlaA
MSGPRWWVLGLGIAIATVGSVRVATAETDAVASAIADESVFPSSSSELAEGATVLALDPTERSLDSSGIAEDTVVEDYDPWEPFNTATFSFNRKVDRYALKPVAKAWDKIVPDPVERSLKRAFDNLSMPRRLVNNLFQLKLKGAGQELARFGLNTTLGVAGLFDVAKVFGVEASEADTGQTLGLYGVGPGPYLVLPFLPPLTARDGIGFAVDTALDPFTYVIFPVAALAGTAVGRRVDERALNLDLYENVEESTVDLYSAVRNGYLQRRQRTIEDSRRDAR